MSTDLLPIEEISHRWDGFIKNQEIIDEKFEDGRDYAKDWMRIAQETIQRLSDLLSNLSSLDTNVASLLNDVSPPAKEDFVATPPTAPSIELNMPEDLETDDVETAIHDKILSDLQSKSAAIPDEVAEAIHKKFIERDELNLADAIDQLSAEWAKRNFTLPNGMLVENIKHVVLDHKNKRSDIDRELLIKDFELTDANMKFAVEKGLQWLTTRIETYKAKIQAEIARIEAIIKKYLGEVDVYKGEADVFKTLTDVELQRFDGELKLALAKADLVIKDAEIAMKDAELQNGLKVEGMKAIAGVAAQGIAGSLSSVSAGVHLSTNTAASYSYSTGETTQNQVLR